MKNIAILLFVAIIILIGAYFFFAADRAEESQPEEIVYRSDIYTFTSGDQSATIRYDENGDHALLQFAGESYVLEHAISASGGRYLSADESVEYWEHQRSATISINSEEVFSGPLMGDETEEENTNTLRDPSLDTREALAGTTWHWKETVYNNDEVVTPNDPEEFVLTFVDAERFSATTDCNTLMGAYEVTESELSFGDIASTKMACADDAQEAVFSKMLSETVNYITTGEGELALMLAYDSGSVMFTPAPLPL